MDDFINLPLQSDVIAQAPQTEIYICGGIPWANDYSHVRLFGSKSELAAFVQSKAVLPKITQSTPVLFGELVYNISSNQNKLMRANYMMFKNSPFSTEWVYAFITNVEWLSVNSARIHFELDVWQNNIYDCELESCFVEREHINSADDVPFANLFPEGMETGDYVVNDNTTLMYGTYNYCLMSTTTPTGLTAVPIVNKTILSGCNVYTFPATSYTEIIDLLQEFTSNGNADAVINVFMCPSLCFEDDEESITIKYPQSLDGYTPKNKKLLQYPYCYVRSDAYNGKTYTYKYELSDESDHSITFSAYGSYLSTPSIRIRPTLYGGNANTTNSYGFIVDCYTQCSWVNDAYQAYLAQNQPIFEAQENILNARNIQSGVQGIASVLGGNLMGGINAVGNIIGSQYALTQQQMAAKESHDLIPPTARGLSNSAGAAPAFALWKTDFSIMTIKADMAKRLDDYFSKFGYLTNKIKKPNMTGRRSWNFVKTIDCGIHGNAVMDDLAKLRAIFDAGVTIWHTNDIGNYDLDNT